MSQPQDLLRVVALLVRHEESIAKLYATFAAKCSGHEKFWGDLAEDEMEHANSLRAVHALIENGRVAMEERKFNLKALQTSLDYLKVLLANAEKGISHARAVAMALQVENSMRENAFFEASDGDGEELKSVLTKLGKSDSAHTQRLRKAMGERKADRA